MTAYPSCHLGPHARPEIHIEAVHRLTVSERSSPRRRWDLTEGFDAEWRAIDP